MSTGKERERSTAWWGIALAACTRLSVAAAAEGRPQPVVVEVGAQEVSVVLSEGEGRVVAVEAECIIPRPRQKIWDVLSDYDRLEEFIPFITESRVMRREPDAIILQQKGRAGMLGLNRYFTVTFRVQESPMRWIEFESFAGDFKRFKGRWDLEERSSGTCVRHEVQLEPAFFMPKWVMRLIARHILLRSLEAVIHRCLSMTSAT